MAHGQYSGAWLTDIDDTLFKSGEFPDDAQIEALARHLRILKGHGVLWAPVSGVAIEKMGPRLLYRLPADVLDHVIYFGGEGSVKNVYDPATGDWRSDPAFSRHFSDAQALAIVGRERYRQALADQHENPLQPEQVDHRIAAAEERLRQAGLADQPSLVDELEGLLQQAGQPADQAQTWFRGGAISWMMFGDISVENYRGAEKTALRMRLIDHLQQRLQQLEYLDRLGETGVHMPYRHATRGIKIVLQGNDKARAARELVRMGIAPQRILFSGNELFEGGNDNPVRQVEGVRLLSVGEKQDPGVLDGGVQTEANREWMETITGLLQQGQPWETVLDALPRLAADRKLAREIDWHKARSGQVSPWHEAMSDLLPTEFLGDLHRRNRERFLASRKSHNKLKKTEYELVARLSSQPGYHYDQARKVILELFTRTKQADCASISQSVQTALLPEIKNLMQQLLVEQVGLKPGKVRRRLRQAGSVSELGNALRSLIEAAGGADVRREFDQADRLLHSWSDKLEDLVKNYFARHARWCEKRVALQRAVMEDERAAAEFPDMDNGDLFQYYIWLAPRLERSPHFKDLDKPTIVLVSGTSGVGKSTVSQHIARAMGIPTGFSSDVASRAVMRQTSAFLLGREKAASIFPELFGSSFDEDSLHWFYAHAMLTMVGVSGMIDRLVRENISAVIDGVALIPGTLPESYFETANIVWITLRVSDREQHFRRLGTRSETGVARGGSERYQKKFSAIRRNHNRLVEMAQRAGQLIIDNSGELQSALDQAVKRVSDPFADRGLPVADSVREEVEKDLQERTTWEVQKTVLGRQDDE